MKGYKGSLTRSEANQTVYKRFLEDDQIERKYDEVINSGQITLRNENYDKSVIIFTDRTVKK